MQHMLRVRAKGPGQAIQHLILECVGKSPSHESVTPHQHVGDGILPGQHPVPQSDDNHYAHLWITASTYRTSARTLFHKRAPSSPKSNAAASLPSRAPSLARSSAWSMRFTSSPLRITALSRLPRAAEGRP